MRRDCGRVWIPAFAGMTVRSGNDGEERSQVVNGYEFPMPFPPGGDCPYASILSSGNKFYTHFNNYFAEFDPVKRAFTFFYETAPQMAMGMTEDNTGVIS
jgi:hypothetical protein